MSGLGELAKGFIEVAGEWGSVTVDNDAAEKVVVAAAAVAVIGAVGAAAYSLHKVITDDTAANNVSKIVTAAKK
ncbi:hypothetical protein [Aeromonas veronii]|uniref:hypothetical protein n=1 Tax=Aeromonas TaxID=642 RepID=UPI0030065D27